jgi:nucleoside-diphosphate-sugar epimerase
LSALIMHILVTGASGFVGQVLVNRLLDQGHHVTALVRPGTGAMDSRASRAEMLPYALGSGDALSLPKGLDAVVHLAQSRVYRAFPADAAEMFRVNVTGTQSLLEAAAKAGISRFCLVSTGSVYEPFDHPLAESAPLAPRSYLGASKLAAEVIARPFAALFALSVLRLFAPYGPSQAERLIPDLIRRVREGQAVTLPLSGGGMACAPTYVDDICNVIDAALEESWSDVLNVASPENLTIQHMAEAIGKVLNKTPVFERKALGAPVVVPDLAKLGARYDMGRFRTFETGIATTIAAT